MWRCLVDNSLCLLLGLLHQEVQAGSDGHGLETIPEAAEGELK